MFLIRGSADLRVRGYDMPPLELGTSYILESTDDSVLNIAPVDYKVLLGFCS